MYEAENDGGIIIHACSSKRYVNPDLVVPCKPYKSAHGARCTRADVQHTYAYIRATADTRVSTHEYESLYKHTGTRIHIKGRIYRFSSHD